MNKQFADGYFEYVGDLDVVVKRANGSEENLGVLSSGKTHKLIGRPIQWWRAFWKELRSRKIIPATLGFAAFLSMYGSVDQPHQMKELFKDPAVIQVLLENPTAGDLNLVVTGGVNYLATDFASGGASPRISAMNYHDSGTGTVAATSTDSGLGTQAGPATRATGTQSNPATNQYRSVGTINYTSTLAITEWGLFSASTSGTMWDRRVFSAINVANGDSIQFTYTLTLNAGGS